MKIYYFNDRQTTAVVRYQDKERTSSYTNVLPATGQYFDVDIPEDSNLFIKVWETNQVFISFIRIPDEESREFA